MIYPFQSIHGIAGDDFGEIMATQYDSHDKVIMTLCSKGNMHIEVNGVPTIINEHDVLFCMPEVTMENYTLSDDFECQIVVTPAEILHDTFYPILRQDKYWYQKIEYLIQHPIIHLTDNLYELTKSYEKIFRIYGMSVVPSYQEQMTTVVAHGMLMVILSWVEQKLEETAEELKFQEIALTSKQDIHFRGFMQLLQEQKGCRRDVAWYADTLNITPKYLAFICKKCCKKSPLQIINETAIREIKQQLLTTGLSIKQIAFNLNFPNASMFCKYFRLHTGNTPLEFRENCRH